MTDTAILRRMSGDEMRHWYDAELCEAFEPQERKPFADIQALLDAGIYEPLGLFEGERLIGYATIWKQETDCCVLMDYLGVTAGRRGSGVGSDILQRLIGRYPDKHIIAEAELPAENDDSAENRLRKRRVAFYMRNGFRPTYEMGACGMRWQVLVSGEALGGEPLQRLIREHAALYRERKDARIPIAPDETPVMPYWMES